MALLAVWPGPGHSASLEGTQVVVLSSMLPQGWNGMASKDALCGQHCVPYDTSLRCTWPCAGAMHVTGPGSVSPHPGCASLPADLLPRLARMARATF